MKIFLPEEENDDEMEIGIKKIDNPRMSFIVEENININEIKDKLLNKGEDMKNLIINYLTLSAIKVNTTFKINKNAIDIKFIPELFITILNTLCSTLTSFSDVTIKLSELTFVNVFSDFDSLYTWGLVFLNFSTSQERDYSKDQKNLELELLEELGL